MIGRFIQLIVAAMLIASSLTRLGAMAEAAQSPANRWTVPAGAFAVQGQEPWIVRCQESGRLLVANGSTAERPKLVLADIDAVPESAGMTFEGEVSQ
jgi:hypothetical protein